MRLRGMLGWVVCCSACTAGAAELRVQVADQKGAGVADAVVTLTSAEGATGERAAPVVHTIDQRDETFVPYVEIMRPGDSVVFHNSDRTRHHVYSFLPSREFEYVLSQQESSPPRTMNVEGAVAVGCNIHDRMITYLFVSAAPYIGRSDAAGNVHLGDLPSGRYTLRLWQPRQNPTQAPIEESITLDDAGAERTFKVSLLPDRRRHRDPERVDY